MIQFQRLDMRATLPTRGSQESAGLDVYCIKRVDIPPGRQAVLPTGFAVAIPPGHYGRIAPRSGLAVKYGIQVHAGVVDADYRGEVKVALINHGDDIVEFKAGDRIAQLIIERCATGLVPEWTDELEDTVRGKGGFGSTGL